MSIKNLPKLVVFDLDGTLWIPEMYELYVLIFCSFKDGEVELLSN
jgi:hypothetical protein